MRSFWSAKLRRADDNRKIWKVFDLHNGKSDEIPPTLTPNKFAESFMHKEFRLTEQPNDYQPQLDRPGKFQVQKLDLGI